MFFSFTVNLIFLKSSLYLLNFSIHIFFNFFPFFLIVETFLMMIALKSCHLISTRDLSSFWHIVTIFPHSVCHFPGSSVNEGLFVCLFFFLLLSWTFWLTRPCILFKSFFSLASPSLCLGLIHRFWPTFAGCNPNDHFFSWALTVLFWFALCTTGKLFQKVEFYGVVHSQNFLYMNSSAWCGGWFCHVMVLCRTSCAGLINSFLQLSPSRSSSFYSTLLEVVRRLPVPSR